MKRRKLHVIWLWGLLFLMTGCGDDDYYYPSVKLEFVTVEAGEDGRIQTLIPDKGEALPVAEDRTGSTIAANISRRVMSNYEVLPDGSAATIYSLQSLIVPVPKPEDDPVYKDGIKQDPVEVVSIWLGRDYLNMILNLKVSTGKGHTFGIVEDVSELKTNGIVNMLAQYIDEEHPGRTINIKFKYCTYDKDGSAVVSEKYCDPGFDYTPGQN